METTYYRKVIHEELARRCAKNPKYSLRAFARALGMDGAALSRILSDQKVPSKKASDRIVEVLGMNPQERSKFLVSLATRHKTRKLERLNQFISAISTDLNEPQKLSTEIFNVIADWYHYAILEVTFLPGFKADPKWVSNKLGISYAEAQLAMKRLLELGFLVKAKNGKISKSKTKITMTDTQTSNVALQRRNKQILNKALEALEQQPVEKRCVSTMTLSIDPKKIPAAKKMILKFNRELCEFLESGHQKQVYELATVLFPLSNQGEV